MPTALLTGINGQDGSYLAEFLLCRGYAVVGLIRSGAKDRCERVARIVDSIQLIEGSLLDDHWLRETIRSCRPREIYNLAARASSSQLFDQPLSTAQYNGIAVAKLLEAVRVVDTRVRFCQASSSEMFGHTTQSPQSEAIALRPRNPYGVAKLFAHGMVGSYREHFGLFACSAILFNHESPRRGPEFVTRKISMAAARIKAGLEDSVCLGNLDATRDWGYSADYVRAMWQMLQAEVADDYVIASGESHSVREFCDIAFSHLGLDYRKYVRADPLARRPPESVPLVGDASKARTLLGWQPTLSFRQLVCMMVDAEVDRCQREDASRAG